MKARWTAFAIWALAAGSLVFWALKLFAPAAPAPQGVVVASNNVAPQGDLTRLLGVDAPAAVEAAPVPNARFQLLGVVAPRGAGAASEGVALIAVDDKPARAYRVGAVVSGETVLQAVHARGASLGPRGGAVDVALDIPPPAAATTGMLPPPAGMPAALPPAVVRLAPGAGGLPSRQPLISGSAPRQAGQVQQQPSLAQQQAQQQADAQPDQGRNGLLPTQ